LHPNDASTHVDHGEFGSAAGASDSATANVADGYKCWFALGIEQLGRHIAAEVESKWMVPSLVEEERGGLMAFQLRTRNNLEIPEDQYHNLFNHPIES
jgi:hypothetical protein